MRTLTTSALIVLLVCASKAQQGDSLPAQAAVHAWNKTAVIEEISPETLAQVAAQRRRAATEPQIVVPQSTLLASSASEISPATVSRQLGGFIPAAPAPGAITDAVAPSAQNELLAQ